MAKRKDDGGPAESARAGETAEDLGEFEDASVQDSLASVVSVDPRDDVAAICGRIDTAPTFAVVVHAPRGNRQLATELGMRRLVRHAEDGGRIVAVATTSAPLAARARQVGVPVARRPEHVRWDAGGKRVFRLRRLNLALPRVGAWAQFIVLLVVLAGLAGLALAMAPGADVVVAPQSETVSQTISIRAATQRTEIDTSGDIVRLPARDITATSSITVPLRTTGPAPAADASGRTVTAADLAAFDALLTDLEGSEAIRRIAIDARPNDAVIVQSVRASLTAPALPAEGEPLDYLLVTVEVTIRATVIPRDVLESLARRVLTLPAGAEFIDGSVRAFESGQTTVDEEGIIIAELVLEAGYASGVTSAEIKKAVKGKSRKDAESILRDRYGMEDPDVSLSPGWAPWLPRFAFRIEVDFVPRKAAATTDEPTPTATPAPGATPAARP